VLIVPTFQESELMIRTISPIVTALCVCLLSTPGQASADVIEDALSGMSANSWQKINLNTFQSVWTPLEQRPARTSPMENISAWSGAAWDGGRSNLLIWGGGHCSACDEGNEVYIFSGNTGLWSRGSLPSQITPPGGIQQTVDGVMNAPLSGESWDNVVFLDNIDRMAVIGVSREGQTWRDPATGLKTGPYFWDPARADSNKVSGLTGSQVKPIDYPDVIGGQMWQNRDNNPGIDHLRGSTAYVNVDGKDVVYVKDTDGSLWRYTVHDLDPASDTWERIGRRPFPGGESGDGSAAIDTTNNMFLHVLTGNSFGFWDLDHPGGEWDNRGIKVIPNIEAGTITPDFRNFGLQFDPTLGAFILWDGSSSVWLLTPPEDLDANDDGILDVATGWQLEAVEVSGAGPEIPLGRGEYTGVYGKWLYLEEYNAYLGVIDPVAGDVFLYKPMYEPIVSPVPEASTAAMLLVGLLGIFASYKTNQRLT
jgi:hypothetical protein